MRDEKTETHRQLLTIAQRLVELIVQQEYAKLEEAVSDLNALTHHMCMILERTNVTRDL